MTKYRKPRLKQILLITSICARMAAANRWQGRHALGHSGHGKAIWATATLIHECLVCRIASMSSTMRASVRPTRKRPPNYGSTRKIWWWRKRRKCCPATIWSEHNTKMWSNVMVRLNRKSGKRELCWRLVNAQHSIDLDDDFFMCRLCVTNEVEMRKCETMQAAAYSRDIRPEFRCVLSDDCIESVSSPEIVTLDEI